jgi:hypothetical protein
LPASNCFAPKSAHNYFRAQNSHFEPETISAFAGTDFIRPRIYTSLLILWYRFRQFVGNNWGTRDNKQQILFKFLVRLSGKSWGTRNKTFALPGTACVSNSTLVRNGSFARNAYVYNSSRVVNASPSGQSSRLQLKSSCKRLLCPEQLAFLTGLELETAALPRHARVYNSSRVVNASPSGQSSRLQLKPSCKQLLCPEQLAFLTRLSRIWDRPNHKSHPSQR